MTELHEMRAILAAMRLDPTAAKHLTPDLTDDLANEDPEIWLRAMHALCKSFCLDPLVQETQRWFAGKLAETARALIAARSH